MLARGLSVRDIEDASGTAGATGPVALPKQQASAL
jgi:hypothetical protein